MAGLEGRTLDRYELRQLMGRGGMADVYLAYDPHFEREVAVKVFKREDEDLLRRFIREAHLMASLSNPYLMPVFDAGTTLLERTTVYYIVMPLMEGGTLRSRIRHSPMAPTEVCRYIRDIANALDYLHNQGIIHRDIKSSNVLLDRDGRCYLSDFGIARTENDATQATSTGNVLGTVDYIAPELFETNQRASPKSDLYSLGVLLFEMVTGELPFTGENQIAVVAMHVSKQPPSPRSLVPSLSATIERVVFKALEKRPERRFKSSGAMADAFCRAAAGLSLPDELMGEPVRDHSTNLAMGTGVYTAGAGSGLYDGAPGLAAQESVRMRQTGHVSSTRSPLVTSTTRSYPSAPLPVQTGYAPRRPAQRRKSGAQGAIVVVLALLAMLAVLVPAGYVLYTNLNPSGVQVSPTANEQTPDLTATEQANQAATTTAQTQITATHQTQNQTATSQAQSTAQSQQNQATATAQANTNATATVQAQATATAGVAQTATAQQPVYSDPLNNANSGQTQAANWDQSDQCVFAGDGYHVKTGLLDSMKGCRASTPSYANFTAKVDVVLVSGQSAGIFFRVKAGTLGNYEGYLFEYTGDGHYRVSRSGNFSSSQDALTEWTKTEVLQKGNGQQNTLQIIARGGELLFYANDVFLIAVNDTNYLNGNIGFLARKADNGAEAIYRNLNIYPVA